jgi:hypothetical protein
MWQNKAFIHQHVLPQYSGSSDMSNRFLSHSCHHWHHTRQSHQSVTSDVLGRQSYDWPYSETEVFNHVEKIFINHTSRIVVLWDFFTASIVTSYWRIDSTRTWQKRQTFCKHKRLGFASSGTELCSKIRTIFKTGFWAQGKNSILAKFGT